MYAEPILATPTDGPWQSSTPFDTGPETGPDTDTGPEMGPEMGATAQGKPILGCAAGSIVLTASGPSRIDALEPGALLVTRKGTMTSVARIDTMHLTRSTLLDRPDLAPIRFDPGTLPDQMSDVAVLLSRDCPVYTTPEPDTALGAAFPASAYCNGSTIRHVIPDEGISYMRLHLSDPAEICIGGLWVQTDRPLATSAGKPIAASSRPGDLRVFTPLKD